MKILVCGGRDYGSEKDDDIKMLAIIDKIYKQYEEHLKTIPLKVVHGGCKGADLNFVKLLRYFCRKHSQLKPKIKEYPADWDNHGKAAGPIRNQQMLDNNLDIDFAIAFRGGRGTADMVKRLKKADIKIITIEDIYNKSL